MAEAGAGKSRLFFEFKATHQSGWMVLEAFSVSHGKAVAYLPVLDLLHGYFEIAGEDDERTRREKVAGKIAILDRTSGRYAALSVRTARHRRRCRSAGADGRADEEAAHARSDQAHPAARVAQAPADGDLRGPALDRRARLRRSWICSPTSIGTAKILLLVNYRPEYSHEWNSKTYYTQLRLDPLGKESADEMLTALLGDGQELIPLKRLDHRAHRRQAVLHRGDRAGAVRRRRAGSAMGR